MQVAMHESVAEGRDAPEGERDPKRFKPDDSGAGMEMDLQSLRKLITVGPHTKIYGEQPPQEEDGPTWSAAWDDMSGQELDPVAVKKARAEEMRLCRPARCVEESPQGIGRPERLEGDPDPLDRH